MSNAHAKPTQCGPRRDGAPSCIPTDTTVNRALADAAIRHAEVIAVESNGTSLTYSCLASTAWTIAEQLRRLGIMPGDRVALLCPRNIEGLSAVLGILSAGGVYVPISPEYPPARITYIEDDSMSSLTLVDSSCAGVCPGARKVVVLQDILETGNRPATSPDGGSRAAVEDDPSRAAYILYTSGSSGRPKGVVVSHSALMNTLAWMAEAFGLAAREAVPQKTAWGFTDSLWELILPLLVGGRVSFIDEDTVKNPVALYRELNKCGAVITQFVPPALSTFLDAVSKEIPSPSLPALRWILNGGEEIPRGLVDRWFSVFPDVGYANSYGMTESAIYATCYFMRTPPVWGMRRIPVGKPIANAEIVILGSGGELLGPDQVGEICVGGRSLMSGYWRQHELTAKVMIPHPKTGTLIYRTGDYGSLRYDGEVAYLGRRDHQIKIRGMRVELGEVERSLMRHPWIKQAVVVPRDKGETGFLIAFYTVHSEDPGEEAVVAHLSATLPRYMIPARCVTLDALPMTAHNKTDRAKLSQMTIPARVSPHAEKAPPGSIEESIWRVWADVLGADDFGVNEGFFAVGGNSLLLVRVYANLPADLRTVLSISDLLHYPTIRALADKVRKELAGIPSEVDTVNRPRRRDPTALSRTRGKTQRNSREAG